MSKRPITHLMIDTSSTDENYNGECDYALVPMSPGYLADLLEYVDQVARMHKADVGVYALECWDSTPRYLCFNEEFETIRDVYGNRAVDVPRGEPILLAAEPKFQEDCFQRVECKTVQAGADGVWWTCYPKHTNVRIESGFVDRKTLLKIWRRFGGQTGDAPAARLPAVHPAIQRIHDLLYLDEKDGRKFHNPDKSWDAGTVSAIAEVVAKHVPRPRRTENAPGAGERRKEG